MPAPGSVHRTLDILEVVAAQGGASAKEIAEATGLPLPTVYRLARELLDSDYLVHIREEKRFELGYKLHAARGLAAPADRGAARRSAPRCTRCTSRCRWRPTSRSTAGRRSSSCTPPTRPPRRGCGPSTSASTRRRTPTRSARSCWPTWSASRSSATSTPSRCRGSGPGTITRHAELHAQLATVADRGVAWEFGEFQPGATCAAAAVRAGNGTLVGSVAVSAPDARLATEAERGAVEAAAARHRLPGQPVLPLRPHLLTGAPFRAIVRRTGRPRRRVASCANDNCVEGPGWLSGGDNAGSGTPSRGLT